MPVYLLHGFRWSRAQIRIHIIMQSLDDAAADWLMAPATTACLLDNLDELVPEAAARLPGLRFVEQYDPAEARAGAQPFAYVADVVRDVGLGVAVDEVVGAGVPTEQWSGLLEVRDLLAPGEKIGWFVVVCGDEERAVEMVDGEEGGDEELLVGDGLAGLPSMGPPLVPMPQPGSAHSNSPRQGSLLRYDSMSGGPRRSGSTFSARTASVSNGLGSPNMSKNGHSTPKGGHGTPKSGNGTPTPTRNGPLTPDSGRRRDSNSPEQSRGGLKGFIGSIKRRASRSAMRGQRSPDVSKGDSIPPVPLLPSFRKAS